MKCKHCGAEISDGARFCENCGNKAEATETAFSYERLSEDQVEVEEPKSYEEKTFEAKEEPNDRYTQNTYEEAAAASTQSGAEKGPIGYSVASMVCGILSLLCCCIPGMGFLLSVAAVVLGIVSLKKNCEGQGMAIAGLVCGGLGLLGGVGTVVSSLAVSSAGSAGLDVLDGFSDLLESL